ncbi:MAG: glutamine amidotransferase-related protein, partial [Fervidobacterium pennivorans]
MFIIIDNYDSFTYNLVQYVMEIAGSHNVSVFRNKYIDIAKIYEMRKEMDIEGIIISPGPGHPRDIPNVVEIIKNTGREIP